MAERVPLLLMAAPRFDLYVNEMAAEIYSTHITYRHSWQPNIIRYYLKIFMVDDAQQHSTIQS